MGQVANLAYVVSRDQFRERVVQERLISVHAVVAGMKGPGGQPVQLVDVDKEMDLFDARLRRPLNHDRMRAALLKEVAG